jgi:CRISPR system Cascade subunit CasE
MYLTRLRLRNTDRAAQRVLADPYRLHQIILLAFDPSRPGGGERVLFRVEPEVRDGEVRILVQSETKPNWTDVPLLHQLPGLLVDAKPMNLALVPGQVLRFRLRGNPTKRILAGKRIALTGETAQLDWVRRKLAHGGFEVAGCRCRDEGVVRAGSSRDHGPAMTLISVLYEGLVLVREPDKAGQTIAIGIGSGKGFGFGLLSLSRG